MKKALVYYLLSFVFLGLDTAQGQERDYPFQEEIEAFEIADQAKPPKKGGLLFIGSSSVRLWEDLEARFTEKHIVKRGVGGCELADFVDYYMPHIVFPYQASKLFVYAGENDIVNGKSAKEVAGSFKKLYELIRQEQPAVPIYYISIKPSNSRMPWAAAFEEANQRISQLINGMDNVFFVDVYSLTNGANGLPDDGFFLADRLHLNSKGYDKWEAVLKPLLD